MPKVTINNYEVSESNLEFLIDLLKKRAEYMHGVKTRALGFKQYLCAELHNVNLVLYLLGDDGPKREREIPPESIEHPGFGRLWNYQFEQQPDLLDRNGITSEPHHDLRRASKTTIKIDDDLISATLVCTIKTTISQRFVIRADVDSWFFDSSTTEEQAELYCVTSDSPDETRLMMAELREYMKGLEK